MVKKIVIPKSNAKATAFFDELTRKKEEMRIAFIKQAEARRQRVKASR